MGRARAWSRLDGVATERMNTMPVTIGCAARHALYNAVLTDLTGCGDIYINLTNGKIPDALRLRRRFAADMRLLDDLGWHKMIEPEVKRFTLTIPPANLRVLIERLYWYGQASLSHPDELDDDATEELHDLCEAAPEILAQLSEEPETQTPARR
jgi:hypothetical protein